MQQYLDSIKASLAIRNYFGAITIALILPDICASVDSDDNKTSGEKYCIWFNKYLAEKFTELFKDDNQSHIIFGPNECYATRCSFLHQGTHIIQHQYQTLKFAKHRTVGAVSFMSLETDPHLSRKNYLRTSDILFIDSNFFCEAMISAVESWMDDIKVEKYKLEKLAAMPNIHLDFHSICNFSK